MTTETPCPRNRVKVNHAAVPIDFIDHYNQHRPHRSLDQHTPLSVNPTAAGPPEDALGLRRMSRCDGLIHEYRNAARPGTTEFPAPTGQADDVSIPQPCGARVSTLNAMVPEQASDQSTHLIDATRLASALELA